MNEKLVKDIIKTRNIIRKKYESLKANKLEDASQFERIFQPITTPLKKLVETPSSLTEQMIKPEIKKKSSGSFLENPILSPPPIKRKRRKHTSETERVDTTSGYDNTIKYDFTHASASTPAANKSDNNEDVTDDSQQFDSSTGRFISSINMEHKDFDYKYGPYFNATDNAWKIGNSPFSIDNKTFFINDKTYEVTPGLTDLLFSKKPKSSQYNEDDIKNYLKILDENNLLHRDFDKNKQHAGNKSFKYKLIKELFNQRPPTGSGLMKLLADNTDYVYWDDVNELVERLKLLIASEQAGHTNHNNEIISILEELKEAKIII